MKKMALITGIALGVLSCGSSDKKSSENVVESSKQTIQSYDCLYDFELSYNLLLTKEEMNAVYPIDFDQAKEDLRSGSYGMYIYTWESDRPSFPMEISGMTMEIPDQNTMGIKMLSFMSKEIDLESTVDVFDMGYKQLSDEELKQIDANLEKQAEEVKATGKDLMAVRAKSSWEAVPNLGSSAWYKWNEQYGGELVVLAGRASFTIIIKISQDAEENKQLAVKLAEKALAKCD